MKRNLIEPVLGFCLLGIVILAVKYGSIHVTGSTDAYIKEMPVVVIDAGHGGTDPGKVGVDGSLEKDINLAVAKRLKTYLEQDDIRVIMTRETDTGLYSDTDSRKKMADKKKSIIPTIILSIISIIWIYPIVMILFNSLKVESAITTSGVFQFPTSETWNGIQNSIASVTQMDFLKSFWYSLVISVMSVVLILLCCSMCAWYIVRVNGLLSKVLYYLCVFSMVVPFQMVMFTLAKTADTLKLNNPYTICIVYLGFGAGLAVFMFTGFVKGSPLEIEEAAMIDGCSPLQVFFKILIPILKPTIISTAILELMWVWNDYLLPTLVLDIKKYKTIPMAIQYFRGSYGHVQMGPMMASIMIDIIPIIVVYMVCQKYIIEGVVAGAVKG